MCETAPMNAPLRTDLNEFLLAPIGEDTTGMPLTLLTVLARLGVDPWEEAADLARLSLDSAEQRLVARLDALPNGLKSPGDTAALASRLVALLHRSPAPKMFPPRTPPLVAVTLRPKRVDPAIYYLVALAFMFVAQWAVTRQPQATVDTTISSAP
jgi:hypothetical protein